jgi:hypothetical protein
LEVDGPIPDNDKDEDEDEPDVDPNPAAAPENKPEATEEEGGESKRFEVGASKKFEEEEESKKFEEGALKGFEEGDSKSFEEEEESKRFKEAEEELERRGGERTPGNRVGSKLSDDGSNDFPLEVDDDVDCVGFQERTTERSSIDCQVVEEEIEEEEEEEQLVEGQAWDVLGSESDEGVIIIKSSFPLMTGAAANGPPPSTLGLFIDAKL